MHLPLNSHRKVVHPPEILFSIWFCCDDVLIIVFLTLVKIFFLFHFDSLTEIDPSDMEIALIFFTYSFVLWETDEPNEVIKMYYLACAGIKLQHSLVNKWNNETKKYAISTLPFLGWYKRSKYHVTLIIIRTTSSNNQFNDHSWWLHCSSSIIVADFISCS